MCLFQELHDKGKSIVFVTHEPDIATFTERTILLSDGLIVKDVAVETKSAREMLESIVNL
jgi:putative ABC transport system ATP-binding protein